MNITKQVIILSAELSNLSKDENAKRTSNLRDCLGDCNMVVDEATGVYFGKEERSFVVLPRNEVEIQVLKDFAFKSFGQDSVLHQDANQEAYLEFADGSSKRLGRLEKVLRGEAIEHSSFTILNGEYYLAKPRANQL